ncbi:MAG: nucleotidyltransferase domain-containing protein [Nitrospirae bacterium]|nr:nucleotidyltransferase domain-containing protein [Nitrospirota bacterium]
MIKHTKDNTFIESRYMHSLMEFLKSDANIIFAFVFGSYAKGRQKPFSDIDIAIYFKNPPKDVELLFIINKLSELAGKDIDLIVLNNASAFLRHQVMKYGIPLAVKDHYIYTKFREKTITDYDEYKYVSGMYVYD